MPYEHVEPELFFRYRRVRFYHCYDDNIKMTHWYCIRDRVHKCSWCAFDVRNVMDEVDAGPDDCYSEVLMDLVDSALGDKSDDVFYTDQQLSDKCAEWLEEKNFAACGDDMV